MKLFIVICFLFELISCRSQSTLLLEEKEIIFENIEGDSTVVFYGNLRDTLYIFRKVEILENSNTDTVLFGFAIIPPGFKGSLFLIQDGLDKSKAVYIDRDLGLDPDNKTSYGKLFTIGLWNKKPSVLFKRLKVKVTLKKFE